MITTTATANDKLSADADLSTTDLDRSYTNNTLAAGVTVTLSFSLYVKIQSGGQEPTYPIDIKLATKPSWVSVHGDTTFPISIAGTGLANAKLVKFVVTGQAAATTGTITFNAYESGTSNELSQSLINTADSAFTVNVAPPSDTTPPVITPNVSGTLGNNGWYTSDVTVSWTVNDPESTVSSTTGCGPTTISADTAGQTLTCGATSAGGTSSQSVTIRRDATAPTISGTASPAGNGAGWNNTNVTVSFTCSDAMSGTASCGPDATLTTEGAGQSATGNAVDNAGNSASATVSGINIDKTAPTASASAAPAANGNGWNNSDVTVTFSGSDALSGIDSCSAPAVLSSEGAGQSVSGTCTDMAGNVSALATASGINIDKTAPSVSLVGGPADGASYYFGFVPAAPTCSASDGLSGLDGSCSVSGYGVTVGTHTVTASATDKAGNSGSASASYTVLAWTLSGFYQPVDMGLLNTVKGGSTVPLKFKIYAGPTELTDTAYVQSFTTVKTSCTGGLQEDAIEFITTGGTSLRYDASGGQFIQNWQTPKGAGLCYRATMTTQDGSTLVALFKTK